MLSRGTEFRCLLDLTGTDRRFAGSVAARARVIVDCIIHDFTEGYAPRVSYHENEEDSKMPLFPDGDNSDFSAYASDNFHSSVAEPG